MTPGRKNRKKKGKGGNNSESSTPQSSTPSVEDEKQQLLQGGACGSSDGRKSRSTEKTKRGSGNTGPSKQSPSPNPGTTSSRNAPQSSHSPEHLAVPGQESSACAQISPSKRSHLGRLKDAFASMKKSPNRSSNPACSCKDERNHQPECPELRIPAVGARDKSSKDKLTRISSNESKPPSMISKKKDGTQSSSSSDPSVAEYFRKDSESEQSTEKSLLIVPDQSSTEVDSSSSKKSPLKLVKDIIRTRRSPNRSSDTECSCEDKTDHEPECPERRREAKAKIKSKGKSPKRSQTKSGASSSSSSSVSKKGKDRASGTSKKSQRSNSKSPNNSDPNAVESLLDKKSSIKSKSNAKTSSYSADYDPLEGTSGGQVRVRREHHSGYSIGGEQFDRRWRRLAEEIEGEPIGEEMIPTIEHIDEVDSEEEGRDPNRPVPRRRSKSIKAYCLRLIKATTRSSNPQSTDPCAINPRPNPQSTDPCAINPQSFWRREFGGCKFRNIKVEWPWFEERWRRRWRKSHNEERRQKRDPRIDKPDDNEKVLLKEVKKVRTVPSVRRNPSLSPRMTIRDCTCPRLRGSVYSHRVGCPFNIDIRKRIRRRKNRFM